MKKETYEQKKRQIISDMARKETLEYLNGMKEKIMKAAKRLITKEDL